MSEIKQLVEVHDQDRVKRQKARVLAGRGYELPDQRTYHAVDDSVIEEWEDTFWGFCLKLWRWEIGSRPKVRRIVILDGQHGIPLQPKYGPRLGWRGAEPTEEEAWKLLASLHETNNAEAAIDSFKSARGSGLKISNAVSIASLIFVTVAVAMVALAVIRKLAT